MLRYYALHVVNLDVAVKRALRIYNNYRPRFTQAETSRIYYLNLFFKAGLGYFLFKFLYYVR